MPRYFTHADYFTNSKNKLTDEFQQYLKEQSDRILESAEEFADFRQEVAEHVRMLNEKHHRCTPIEPHWYGKGALHQDFDSVSGTTSWRYSLWNGCSISVYKAKN